MKVYFIVFCCSLSFLFVNAQKSIVYDFNNTLIDTSGKMPALLILGRPGVFVKDTLHELNNCIKTLYQFDINSGVSFDNNSAGRFLTTDYTIELYFKFEIYNSWKRVIDFKNKKSDTGPYIYFRKAAFYKNITEEIPVLKPGEFIHYILTRNSSTHQVNIYLDGKRIITFTDTDGDAVIDLENKLNLFHDNHTMGNEASAGAIALFKIYTSVISADEAKKHFIELASNFQTLNKRRIVKPRIEVVLKGNIYDSRSGAPIPANLVLELASDSAYVTNITNNGITGDFTVKIPAGRFYTLTASSKGFEDHTDLIDLTTIADPSKPFTKDISLTRMTVGKTISLNKISFLQSRYELLPSSYAELDKIATLMLENKTMEIQLHGHTDNQGDAKLNLLLSEQRVNAVKEYLMSKGVNGHHVKGKGHGGSKPIASNSSEATRKLNRRVELTILKF